MSTGPAVPPTSTAARSVLRALTRLDRDARPRTELVDAVMHYVPGAVALGYVDNPDFELPLPGPDFAEHISILLSATSAAGPWMEPPHPRRTSPRLPCRPREPRSEPTTHG